MAERTRGFPKKRMTQREVNDALRHLLYERDLAALDCLMQAISRGEIALTTRGLSVARVTAIAAGPIQEFAQRLRDLRQHAGDPTLLTIATHVGMSTGSMTRIFQGQSRTSWSVVKDIILFLGGDPADYREDYAKAKGLRPGPRSPHS